MSSARVVLAGACGVLAVALATGRADAHPIGLSNGEYAARGAALDAKLVFARGEIARLVPELDENHDGHVTALEVHRAQAELGGRILRGVNVTAGGEACAPVLTGAAVTEQDGIAVQASFACPIADGAPMTVELSILDELAFGHRHVARAVGRATRDEVLSGDHRSIVVEPEPYAAAPEVTRGPERSGVDVVALFRMGIEHILMGYDHLVFLLALVLVPARVRALLAVVTAFTIAHSVSLALAALDVLAPSSRLVEPAIALSIVYVGIENLYVEDGSKRWRITFPFGLVHGFGFAGALHDVAIPRSDIGKALASFNLGVEVGQLAVLSVVLPVVFLLRDRRAWITPRAVRVLSGAVAIAGGVWFLARVLG